MEEVKDSALLSEADRTELKLRPGFEVVLPTHSAIRRLSDNEMYSEYVDAFRAEIRRVLTVLPTKAALTAARKPDANRIVGRVVVNNLEKCDDLTDGQVSVLNGYADVLNIDLKSGTAQEVCTLYRGYVMSGEMLDEMEKVIDQTREYLEGYLQKSEDPQQEEEATVNPDLAAILKVAAQVNDGGRSLSDNGSSDEMEDGDYENDENPPRKIWRKVRKKTYVQELQSRNERLREVNEENIDRMRDFRRENERLMNLVAERGEDLFNHNGMLHLPALPPSYCIDLMGIFRMASCNEGNVRSANGSNRYKDTIAHLFRALLIAIPDPDAYEDKTIDSADWDEGALPQCRVETLFEKQGVKSMVYPDLVFPHYWDRKTLYGRVFYRCGINMGRYREELLFVRSLFGYVIQLCSETKYVPGKDRKEASPELKRLQDEIAELKMAVAEHRGAVDQARTALSGMKVEAMRTADVRALIRALRTRNPSVLEIARALSVNAKTGPMEAVIKVLQRELKERKKA